MTGRVILQRAEHLVAELFVERTCLIAKGVEIRAEAATARISIPSAIRRARSTKSSATRYSARWRITRPVTSVSICASGWASPDVGPLAATAPRGRGHAELEPDWGMGGLGTFLFFDISAAFLELDE